MDDLEWIKDISVDNRVTTDNWYQGMRVKLNPDSIFADQSEEIGVIIDSEADLYFCSEKDSDSNDSMCYWITVEWEDGYENNYRIGPYEWDLLIDADSYLNESDDLDWIKDVEPRLPLKIGTCLTFKQYEEVEDWIEDEYGNMVDHGKMDWHIIGKFIDEYNDNKPTFKMVATDRMGEGREIWMEVEKVKELYDRGVYKPCKKQTYLKRIMKEEIDDLGWIKDIEPPSYDSLVGKALYFDPHINTPQQLKSVIKPLKMLGFHYGTWVNDFIKYGVEDYEDEEIIGLYLRRDDGGITYTAWIDEDYEYHISDWAGEPVQVLDGWQVLQPFI